MSEGHHLAQFNIARIKYPLVGLRMREFVDNVECVNGLAEKIEGFVWRLQDEVHGPTDYAFGWESLPAAQMWKKGRGVRLSEQAA